MTKLLSLGGSGQQIQPLIRARRRGWETVLCDYLPDNPGQDYADRYYCVSTTDQEAILKIALQEKVDGVIAYASDPAAPTAAYVAEQMGLPGHPYESVLTLTDKGRYRAFLEENGFATPTAGHYASAQAFLADADRFCFPCMIKPVDSSGSKGVSLMQDLSQLSELVEDALSFSRSKRFIVEEYVRQPVYQVAGDGFSIDGQLVFRCFGNDHFDPQAVNPFVPVAASFPSVLSTDKQNEIHDEIQRLLSLLNMGSGAYNFDIRIGLDDKIYLMEVGPRNGGNYIPELTAYATGVDMIDLSLSAALNRPIPQPSLKPVQGYWAYYSLHSNRPGRLKQIEMADDFRNKHLVEEHLTVRPGEPVQAYTGSNTGLGILLLRFDSMEQMLQAVEMPETWHQIVLDD
jgi:biotin carboxylase